MILEPPTATQEGRPVRYEQFSSDHVAPRNVDVLLPESYTGSSRRYPVLYMHDGQNLFEPELSFSGVDWGVQRTLSRLYDEEGLRQVIVVGIWNTPSRIPEYMPERPLRDWADPRMLARFQKTYGARPQSDAYLKFLVDELKPFIDKHYRTVAGRDATWIMGSSMGGLVSLYAACEYPEVFGSAASLSTSWTIGGRVMLRYLERKLPRPDGHRFYLDYGSEAQIARYESLQKTVNRALRTAGYRRDANWMTRRFPGASHDESAWRDRLDIPLRFFLSSPEGPD
jgi:predicted alpha/beta superfamily hydrolase